MFHRRLAGLALLLSAAGAAAATPWAGQDAAANRVHATVQFLADDLLEGRGTGTRGHEIAAAYVASQFEALGLKPGGENGGWYQWVPFRRATNVPGAARASLGKSALGPNDITVRPSLTEKVRDVTAPLVFVGYGLGDARLGTDDYAGLDTRGAIVVAFSGTPDGLPSDVAAHLSQFKDEIALAHGAVGMIEIGRSDVAGLRERPFGSDRPLTGWVDSAGQSGGGSALRLSASERLFAAAPKRLAAVRAEASRKGARPHGFALRQTLSIHAESAWEDFRSPEVIGVLPGADPLLKSENVLLMGHLDHLGIKKNARPGEDSIYNGALDNAAGVSTMLEAAREFVDSGRRPRRSVMFIANTGEELGLLGAGYFAAHPTVPLANIAGSVDLDMPVPLYPFTDVVAFGGEHSTLLDAIRAAGRDMGVGISPDPMPEQGVFTRSDHYQLVKKGIPAVLLFTGYANGGKEKWDDFFAHRYHQVGDDLTQPIDWAALARYARFNYLISRHLADADRRPVWYKGDYFGDLFQPGGPRAPRP